MLLLLLAQAFIRIHRVPANVLLMLR